MGPPVAVIKESPQFDVADTDVPLTVALTGPPIIVEEIKRLIFQLYCKLS